MITNYHVTGHGRNTVGTLIRNTRNEVSGLLTHNLSEPEIFHISAKSCDPYACVLLDITETEIPNVSFDSKLA